MRRQAAREGLPPIEVAHAPPAPPVLRLVRLDDERFSREPDAAGRSSSPIDRVPGAVATVAVDVPQASQRDVAAAADSRAEQEIAIDADLVTRSFDAREINRILADPSVFKYAASAGFEKLDATPLVADPNNYLLMADGGGILALYQEPGIYEIHTNFIKPDRERQSQQGPYIRNACLAAYKWLFTRSPAMVLLTRIPAHNRAATVFSPLVGWVKEFERSKVWATVDGELVDVGFYALRYDDWVRKTPDIKRVGRAFHDRLEAEFARHGKAEEAHADDDWHDLHVGSAVEMIRGGQPEKGVVLYNRWARFAGYGLLGLVSIEPTVIDIGNALLQMMGNTFKVVAVR